MIMMFQLPTCYLVDAAYNISFARKSLPRDNKAHFYVIKLIKVQTCPLLRTTLGEREGGGSRRFSTRNLAFFAKFCRITNRNEISGWLFFHEIAYFFRAFRERKKITKNLKM